MYTLLVPKEKPVLSGLHGSYINYDKFIEHLRKQFGAGCVHFVADQQEALLFFSKSSFLPSKIYQNDEVKELSGLDALLDQLDKDCHIDVYRLTSDAISFWSHLPAKVEQKQIYAENHNELKSTFDSFTKNNFSGYLSICKKEDRPGGILFFGQGEFLGGSYSWGEGGLDSSLEHRNQLAHQLDTDGEHIILLGQFLYNQYYDDIADAPDDSELADQLSLDGAEQGMSDEAAPDIVNISDLSEAGFDDNRIDLDDIDGYIAAFHEVLKKKNDAQLLKEKFLEHLDLFPFLDPFLRHVDYSYGLFHYHGDEDEDSVARAVITCIREIVREQRVDKKFSRLVEQWPGHKKLLEKGVLKRY